MLKKNKNILIILSIVIVLVVSIFFVFNRKDEYKELPRVKLKNQSLNSSLAIMVENDYKTEQYTKWENKEFPTDGYTLNRIKSGCVDKNGNNIDALTYSEDNKTISIKTKQSVYCYLYYDNLFKGKGTEDEPYEINYIEDLVRLSNSVNKDSNTYNSKYFVLKRNLDFNTNESYMKYNDTGFGDINSVSGVEGIKDELTNQEGSGFIPIGLKKSFEGNINGKNNKISNLWIYNTINEDQKLAFIGILDNGSISNLTITGEVKATGRTPLGGLVNRIVNSTIDNCTNEINITSGGNVFAVGGLVGWSNGDATIKNSTNRGNIINGGYNGGIIAGNQGGTLTIENCKNYGKIENNLGHEGVGGLVGDIYGTAKKTIIKNSVNYGEIKINNKENVELFVGGIFGRNKVELEIVNSHNEGVVDINGTTSISVGGLIGLSTDKTLITSCYNLGEINSMTSGNSGNRVGGLAGYINSDDSTKISKIENSYNKGNINGGDRTGGILGVTYSNLKLIINKCYNSGTIITGKSDTDYNYVNSIETGGIIGQVWDGTTVYILNSYNEGEIINNPKNVTGHVGGIIFSIEDNSYKDGNYNKKSNGYIINSYNKGKITAKNSARGISGINNISTISLNNVYNIGEINAPSKAEIIIVDSTGEVKSIDNTYYKEGLVASNKSLTGLYPITDINMKNADLQDNNSLIYKLNQNVININKSGLSSLDKDIIGTALDGYTLVNWVIDPVTGYPTLDYNLES